MRPSAQPRRVGSGFPDRAGRGAAQGARARLIAALVAGTAHAALAAWAWSGGGGVGRPVSGLAPAAPAPTVLYLLPAPSRPLAPPLPVGGDPGHAKLAAAVAMAVPVAARTGGARSPVGGPPVRVSAPAVPVLSSEPSPGPSWSAGSGADAPPDHPARAMPLLAEAGGAAPAVAAGAVAASAPQGTGRRAATPADRDAQVLAGNPLPAYPAAAHEDGLEGLVALQVQVDAHGLVRAVHWLQRSGVPVLDMAARDAVRHWRFQPALRAGEPVAGTVTLSLRFRLDAPVLLAATAGGRAVAP